MSVWIFLKLNEKSVIYIRVECSRFQGPCLRHSEHHALLSYGSSGPASKGCLSPPLLTPSAHCHSFTSPFSGFPCPCILCKWWEAKLSVLGSRPGPRLEFYGVAFVLLEVGGAISYRPISVKLPKVEDGMAILTPSHVVMPKSHQTQVQFWRLQTLICSWCLFWTLWGRW